MTKTVPLSGRLEKTGLPRILNYLYDIKSTGTLTVESDGVTKRLYLKDGGIIFANSSYEGDRLGEMLLKVGKINVKQFDEASRVVKETGKRLGGVLVELGYLNPKDLFWGVKYQVQEIVCSLFTWPEGDYSFVPGPLPTTEVITLHMSTSNLVLQGVKSIDDWTRISRGIPSMGSVLRLTSDPVTLYKDLSVSEDERQLLALFDGSRTIKDVFDQAKISDFRALKAVYVFYTLGMLEEEAPSVKAGGGKERAPVKAAPAPAAAQSGDTPPLDKDEIARAYGELHGQNHYEVLKLDYDASTADIDAAYKRLAKLYHPDQRFREGMDGLSNELERLFSRVNEAYTILSDDSRRWEYDLSLTTLMTDTDQGPASSPGRKPKDPAKAQEAFRLGSTSLKNRDFESATVRYKEATRLDPTKAEYFSALALAMLNRPRREAEAEEAMLEAVKLDPQNPDMHANLGLLYKKAGIRDKARDAFKAALKLDPNSVKAKRGMEGL